MPLTTWLNGEFVDADLARVSATDAGLQHGVGLFETMLAADGRVFRLHDHLARLQRSARTLGLSHSLRVNPLAEAVRRTVERAGEPRARVRLTITGGSGFLRPGASAETPARSASDPTILIVAQPAPVYPEAMFERGVTVTLAEARISHADPWAGHKTLNYWWRLRELQAAAARGGAEALLFDTANRLASGMVSNVFLVRGGALRTPPAQGDASLLAPLAAGSSPATPTVPETAEPPRPVLPGVTRRAALDWASDLGLRTSIEPLTLDDLLTADEVALTNSAWGVLPVVRAEGHTVSGGTPGPVTLALRAKWERAVFEENET